MRHLGMADARRLMDARAGLGGDLADALVVEFHPAAQDVIHLEVEIVLVPAEAGMAARLGADDMRHGAPAGGGGDAEVAILEAGSQPAIAEDRLLGMRGGEAELGVRRHGFLAEFFVSLPRS